MILIANSKLYDKLKFLAQILLPALGTLYFTLAGLWSLPKAEEVVGTVLAIDTFLGVILQLSSAAYANKESRFAGDAVVTPRPDGTKAIVFNLNGMPEEIVEDGQKEIAFKIKNEHSK